MTTLFDCTVLNGFYYNVQHETGVLITEAFMVRDNPQWHWVRDRVQDGTLEPVMHFEEAIDYRVGQAVLHSTQ